MKRLEIDSLEKGYCESDVLILYSAFQVLTNFMEKEDPANAVDWYGTSKKHGRVWGSYRISIDGG